jgi:hypothetical protein
MYTSMFLRTNVSRLLVFFFISMVPGFAELRSQTLNETRDVVEAYRRGTRSLSGKPGKKYWQNSAVYDISVTVLPPSRTISGSETITYRNNSPDTLKSIIIKLILNEHKAGKASFGRVDKDYLTTGIKIEKLLIDGKKTRWTRNMGEGTWQELPLAKPLLPGAKVKMEIDWNYPISRKAGREGMLDPTTFFLAYFYPRVAVYDDYAGWDKSEFNGGPEFYNDFNDYSLKISVPANYVVWATGVLKNPGEVLQEGVIDRLKLAAKSDSTISVASINDLKGQQVTKQNKLNTWHFEASNVPDVAAGLSDHYIWDASSVVVDSTTSRRAEMHAAYSDTASAYRKMVQDGRYALNWFSHQLPGVPYPYPKMSAFEGNADMEYPMMINDTSIEGPNGRRVTNHEIAHSWFPFYMGTNETRYAFMDEGWASTLELLIGRSYAERDVIDDLYKLKRVKPWIQSARPGGEVPIITPSNELKAAYRFNAYNKPSLAYMALIDLLGEDLFKKCLLEYMGRWNGKHPMPWDFFYTFNDVSGRSLNWFWNNWFFSTYYVDLSLRKVEKSDNGYAVYVRNTGGFAVPFDVVISYEDGTLERIHQSPAVWEQNEKEVVVHLGTDNLIRKITLDGDLFMDANINDNSWMDK